MAVGIVVGASAYAAAWLTLAGPSPVPAAEGLVPVMGWFESHLPALLGLASGALATGVLHARAFARAALEWAEEERLRTAHLDDKVAALSKLNRDLEHHLTERHHLLGEIFESLPGEVSWVSRDLRYVRVNGQLAAAEGLYPRDFEGRPVGFTGRPAATRVRAALQEFFAGASSVRECLLEAEPGGEREARLVSLRRFRNGEDAFVVVCPLAPDSLAALGPRARATEEPLQASSPGANQNSGTSSRHTPPTLGSARLASLGEMVAGIAHEINNPLAILNGRVQVLRTKAVSGQLSNEELLLGLDKLSQTVFRVSKIITGLRSFVRPGTGEQPEDVAPLRAIEDALDFCKGRFHKQNIRIVFDVSSRSLVRCVPVQLSQILLNLLNNALHALDGHAERWVRIEAHDRGEMVEFRVVDSGPGVPAAIADRIFEPFFTTKDHAKGTGLGLSISRGLAESNGGSLRLDPIGPNTAFVLTLPSVPDESGTAQAMRSEVLPDDA